MIIFKRIIFSVPFLLSFIGFLWQLSIFLQDPTLILGFSTQAIIQLGLFLLFLSLTSLIFVVFSTLASDWKIVIPTVILASILTILIIVAPINFVLGSGTLVSFSLVYFLLERKLSSYLTFKPSTLLLPSIKQILTLLIIISSFAFYISANMEIPKRGFKLPESVIDLGTQFSMGAINSQNLGTDLDSVASQEVLSPEQAQLLKQNPALLKQFGIDPKVVDMVSKPKTKSATPGQDLIKSAIEQQLNNFIQPYIKYIPIVLAVLFFVSFMSITSLVALFLYPLLWFIFYTLEALGFTQYITEMREVKKLVV